MEKTVKPVLETVPVAAQALMKRKKVNTVWQCEKTGAWFTSQELAVQYEKKNKIKLKVWQQGI
jgi:hypothetical protein